MSLRSFARIGSACSVLDFVQLGSCSTHPRNPRHLDTKSNAKIIVADTYSYCSKTNEHLVSKQYLETLLNSPRL